MNSEKLITVFVVDDNPVFSLALKGTIETAFQNRLVKIHLFETGEKCMSRFYELMPELIVLDYNLNSVSPDAANGLEILNEIKQKDLQTSVIMLTNNDHIEVALKSYQYGIADYIIKGQDQFSKITQSIAKIFAGKDLASSNEEKERRALELLIADKRIAFQNEENEKRADELKLQNQEKKERLIELMAANDELAFQKKEKEKLAEELIITNLEKSEIERSKLLIEERNKNITDSINYAKRIQTAKLPKKEEIYSALSNCFVLFKPKDIVSGDFYSFHKDHQSLFIAASDCTGHGVPGAFMSMIGSEQLNEAVAQSSDTSTILSYLNKGIKRSLQQSESPESTRDGMDIAICSVDTINRIVKFAGANRPLWIIRKGQTEVEEIKGTKKAIGGLTEDDQHFLSHEIQLQKGDTFYISTDGYADQFGGPSGKKLMTKKFKQILLEIQEKSMSEQKDYLEQFVEDWKSDKEQVDDILVIGVRL
ncbi:MAG TPA: SpoIIE family protein phosphatase [Bacteroidia bacterium]|jgi:serine phosphatase RsbU (regulator of sigma subunit)/ActR/RegA family two-component response regulator